MAHQRRPDQKKIRRQEKPKPDKKRSTDSAEVRGLTSLQKRVGNQAVQRLLAQRSGEGSVELDEGAARRINRERDSGQPLPEATQQRMGSALGYDVSDVRVHTSPEADELNRQLDAEAFTTGRDVFFREGTYNPHSSDGQELIAHELTHVVDQSEGAVQDDGSGTTVHPPNDVHEQRADAVAHQVTHSGTSVQRAYMPGEGMQTRAIQRQAPEEELEMKALQRQDEEEDLEMKALQRQDEEDELAMKALQRQDEEEELEMKALQRQDEEDEELEMKALQRQDEDEELEMKAIQRQDEEEDLEMKRKR